jgi:fructose-specific phosphotransferase system IIC component
LLILGFFFGGLAAAIVSAGLCATEPQNKAYITIGVVIAIGVLNFFNVPAPTWVIIATMVGYIIAGLLGARLGARWWASRAINQR